jgi:hypothetical protein
MTDQRYPAKWATKPTYDAEMEPYMSLFSKPLTNRKSEFTRNELDVMCKDPLHSPRLIRYLIDFIKEM